MEIQVNKSIYSREALLKAAYTFTDRAYLHLSQDKDNWIISWTPKEDSFIAPQELENELIAQQLRTQLLEKTAEVRKLVLARAFASTIIDMPDCSMENGIPESASFEEDDNVLKGWFDQNGSF